MTDNITLDTTALDNTILQLGQSMHQLIIQQQQNQVLNQTLTQSANYNMQQLGHHATVGPCNATEPIPTLI